MSDEVRRSSASTAVSHALIVVPICVFVWSMRHFWAMHVEAVDFRSAYLPAGRDVLNGLSPYHPTPAQLASGLVFVYPALAALLFSPFSLLGTTLGAVAFTCLCLLSLGGTLYLLGVRDHRVYGAVLLWSPVVTAWQAANLTLPLALGLALVWRYSRHPLVCGMLVAVLVSIKPFVWPLALWLLATRRLTAFGWAALIGVVVNVLAWSIVGFNQFAAFLHVSGQVIKVLTGMGYGIDSVGAMLGLGAGVSTAIMVVLAGCAAVACVFLGRRGRDETALALAVVLMLVASPVVDFHYFSLLVVAAAIARPRLHLVWLAPLLLWVCPPMRFAGWTSLLWWMAVGLMLGTVIRRYDGSSARPKGWLKLIPGMAEAVRGPTTAVLPEPLS